MKNKILKSRQEKTESIFLHPRIAIEFNRRGYDFLYIPNLDMLFAVVNITYPYEDHNYFDFTGYPVNNFRDNEWNNITTNMVDTLEKREPRNYQFSGSVDWIFERKVMDGGE